MPYPWGVTNITDAVPPSPIRLKPRGTAERMQPSAEAQLLAVPLRDPHTWPQAFCLAFPKSLEHVRNICLPPSCCYFSHVHSLFLPHLSLTGGREDFPEEMSHKFPGESEAVSSSDGARFLTTLELPDLMKSLLPFHMISLLGAVFFFFLFE